MRSLAFEESLQVVQWLEQAGVDLIEISGGTYEQPKLLGLQGMEEEGQLLIERTEDVRADYQRKLAEQRAQIASMTNRLGWTFNVHHTDKQPHTALVRLHNRLAEQSW